MKKELIVSLLNKLQGYNFSPITLKKLMQRSSEVLIKINNLDEPLIEEGIAIATSPYKTTEEIITALNIYQNSDPMQRDYVVMILLNKEAIKKGIALEGAEIISTVKDSFNGSHISRILTNVNILKSGIGLMVANILKDTKQSVNSSYICEFLTKVFETNENNIDLNFILSFVQILKASPQEFNVRCILRYYEKGPIMDYDATLEMAKAINGIEDFIDLRSTYLLLGENLEVAFKLIGIIAGRKEDLIALKQVLISEDEKERMYEYLKSVVLKNLNLYKTFNNLSKIILGREIIIEAKFIRYITPINPDVANLIKASINMPDELQLTLKNPFDNQGN